MRLTRLLLMLLVVMVLNPVVKKVSSPLSRFSRGQC